MVNVNKLGIIYVYLSELDKYLCMRACLCVCVWRARVCMCACVCGCVDALVAGCTIVKVGVNVRMLVFGCKCADMLFRLVSVGVDVCAYTSAFI